MSRDSRYRDKDKLAADVSKAIAESKADVNIGIDDSQPWQTLIVEEAGKGLRYFPDIDAVGYSNEVTKGYFPKTVDLPSGLAPEYKNDANWTGWNITIGTGSLSREPNGILRYTCTGTGATRFLKNSGLDARADEVWIRARVVVGSLTGHAIVAIQTTGSYPINTTLNDFVALGEWQVIKVKLGNCTTGMTQCGFDRTFNAGDIFEVSDFIILSTNTTNNFLPGAIPAEAIQALGTFPVVHKVKVLPGELYAINLAIVDANFMNRYELILQPGEHFVLATPEIITKDYIDISGVRRDTCKITGYLAPETSNATIAETSCIKLHSNTKLKNFTVTIQNGRYAIHNDGGRRFGLQKQLINLYAEHKGNDEAEANRTANAQDPNLVWQDEVAVGSGSFSGEYCLVDGCELKGSVAGYATHNNVTFVDPSILDIKNSVLTATHRFGSGLIINSINSGGVISQVNLSNVQMSGPITVSDSGWSGTNTLTHREFDISMSNCTPQPFLISTAIANDSYYRPVVLDREKKLFNMTASTILRGMALAHDATYLRVRPMVTGDPASAFVGIALADIPASGQGRVALPGGYEKDNFIYADGVVTAAFGTSYGISTTVPGAFKIGATPAIAVGVAANILKF